MEEDIKILENYFNYECTKRLITPPEIQAIEHLIERNKELEELLDKRLWDEHLANLHEENIKLRDANKKLLQQLLEENSNHIPRID